MKHLVSFVLVILLFAAGSSRVHAKLWINEFSSDSGTDWVEIYNDSETDVVPLSAYQLKDNSTSGNPLALTGLLSPKGFVTFDWGSSLNKSGDVILLIDTVNNNEEVDKVAYGEVEGKKLNAPIAGQSGGRSTDGGVSFGLFSSSTKGSTNTTAVQAPTATPEPTATPKATLTPTRTPTPTKVPTQAKTPTQVAGKSPTVISLQQTSAGSVRGRTNSQPTPTVVRNVPTAVLAAKSQEDWPTIAPTEPEAHVQTLGVSSVPPSYALIALGVIIIAAGGGYTYYKQRKNQ